MAVSGIVTLLLLVLGSCAVQSLNVYELIEETPELSEFLALVKGDALMSAIMQQEEGTVFAPNNEAMAKFRGIKNYQLLKYHLVNLAWPSDQLRSERTVLSRLKGSQPLFITVKRRKSGKQDTFLNNARIVRGDMKASSSQDGQSQILHIIDEVLEPTIPNIRDSKYFNPTAMDYLSNSGKYDMTGDDTILKFYAKVREFNRASVFDTPGFNTYFIPIDSAFDPVRDRFDAAVVEGHVIPDKVLFMRTMGNESYHTSSYTDTLKVTARLHSSAVPDKKDDLYYEVQSTTLVGDLQYPTGTVLSRVVRPNIAVKNGVMHLIQRPLMVTNSDVFTFIKENHQDRVHEFFKLMQLHGSFSDMVMSAKLATIFIPSNEAFHNVQPDKLDAIKEDMNKLTNLLNLHLARERVTTDDVRNEAINGVYNVASDDPTRPLYLSASGDPINGQTLFVDGGGTNATVIVPDIIASNGVVHIIDQILGIPYRSVGEKLAMNTQISLTNQLAEQDLFSKKVSRMDRNYTMFVPSNAAWGKLRMKMPTTYKTLFTDKAAMQASRILDRHLIIGQSQTIQQLSELSQKENGIKTFRSKFMVEHIPGSAEYMLKWENLQARVVRANLECTNGFIHVIDTVMMRKRDVTTSGAAYTAVSSALLLGIALSMLRL